MEKIVWIVICLLLSGFRVSSLETDQPFYGTETGEESLSQKDGSYVTTTVRGKLREDMEEFSFDIEAQLYDKNSTYRVRSVTVREGEETIQVISVPELSLFGETAVWADDQENMGLELDAISSAVIGGTLLTGGVGTVIGSLVGVLIQGIIQTIVTYQNLNTWWTKVTFAGILCFFILIQRFAAIRADKKKKG